MILKLLGFVSVKYFLEFLQLFLAWLETGFFDRSVNRLKKSGLVKSSALKSSYTAFSNFRQKFYKNATL